MKNFAVATLLATCPFIALAQSGVQANKSITKFDCKAGEKILYSDNFEQATLGQLPAGWNTNGTGEITMLSTCPGKWLRLHHPYTYLTANTADFGENYTIEFDLILQLKSSDRMFPQISLGLFSAGTASISDNETLKEDNKYGCVTALISPANSNNTKAWLKSYVNGKSYFVGEPKALPELEQWYGQPVHIAIQVQKERYSMWANAVKIFDVPNGVPVNYVMNQLQFRVHHTNYKESEYGIYISNIIMAKDLVK
jgi:OmpA-OmpF porin, OOP family